MTVDSYGLPIEFNLMGGEVHDSKAALDLIASLPDSDYVVADRGYNSESIREIIRNRKTIPVIHGKQNSKIGNADMD